MLNPLYFIRFIMNDIIHVESINIIIPHMTGGTAEIMNFEVSAEIISIYVRIISFAISPP